MEERIYNGHTYRRAGPGDPWVLVDSGPRAVTVNPGNPYGEQTAQATATRTTNEAAASQYDPALAAAELEIKRLQAEVAATAEAREQAQWDAEQSRGGFTAESAGSMKDDAAALDRLRRSIEEVEKIHTKHFVGRNPAEYLPTEASRRFNEAAGRMRVTVARAMGLTGQQFNTPEEARMFIGPMIPSNTDFDGEAIDKINALKGIYEDGARALAAKTGQPYQPFWDPVTGGRVGEEGGDNAPPGDGEASELDGFPGLTGSVTDTTPSPYDPGGPLNIESVAPYQQSLLGQGMSGVNEGIADILGFPVDLMTGAMNLGSQGVNALTNSQIPSIDNPILGSQWIRDVTGDLTGGGLIYDQTDDPTSQFVRRVGQSVGASAVPVGAMANTARQGVAGMLAATGGGIGGATAQQVAPGNVGAEIAAEMLGGGLAGGGLAMGARRAAQREIESAIPTTQELRTQAGELYRAAEAGGEIASPQMTIELRDELSSVLRDAGRVSPTGRISEVYPKAREAMLMAEDYAGSPMSPTQVQTVRDVIADGLMSKEPKERRIARLLTDTFDDWAAQNVPGLDEAREVSSRYLTAEQLQQAREMAEAGASQFTGSGIENALRTQYRGLDRNVIRGKNRFSDDLVGAIEDVSRGTPSSNLARNIGRMAPSNPLNALAGSGMAAAAGTAIGGPIGGLLAGALPPTMGAIGRSAATRMTERGADIAELIARSGGPIEQAPLLDEPARNLIAAILAGQMAGVD